MAFGGLVALSDVSLAVPPSTIVGLMGPNGAGKTTLFGVMSGLLRPRSGTVSIGGHDVTRSSPQARAKRGLARTFQRLELFGELTVREHLVVAHRARHRRLNLAVDLLGLGARPGPGESDRVDAILNDLGLAAVASHSAAALPLGTGRLVEVARAMASEPKVLLLDEPSSGLDTRETEQLGEALRRLHGGQGVSLLLVEHNVEFVLALAQQVTVLDFGRVIAEGTPAEIRGDHAVQAAYLGVSA